VCYCCTAGDSYRLMAFKGWFSLFCTCLPQLCQCGPCSHRVCGTSLRLAVSHLTWQLIYLKMHKIISALFFKMRFKSKNKRKQTTKYPKEAAWQKLHILLPSYSTSVINILLSFFFIFHSPCCCVSYKIVISIWTINYIMYLCGYMFRPLSGHH